MITKLRSSLLLNKFSLSAPEENVDNSMKNMLVADPDLELREGSTWFFVASALPAFLPSTILFLLLPKIRVGLRPLGPLP